ncbi:hypothetical protein Hanom_Chr14g01272031 [Helianthus anomalus]
MAVRSDGYPIGLPLDDGSFPKFRRFKVPSVQDKCHLIEWLFDRMAIRSDCRCSLVFAWEDVVEGSGMPCLFLFFCIYVRFRCIFVSFVHLCSFNPENTKGRQKHTFSNIGTKKG